MTEAAQSSSASPQSEPTRQAVILIHGMGEQSPMETVREFASTIWALDSDVVDSRSSPADEIIREQLFFVPDPRAGSHDLRRVSTARSRQRWNADGTPRPAVRTDFYELYWADITRDNRWLDFSSWYRRLLCRWPSEAPEQVRPIWWLLWLVTICVAVIVLTPMIVVLQRYAPSYLLSCMWVWFGLPPTAVGFVLVRSASTRLWLQVGRVLFVVGVIAVVFGALPSVVECVLKSLMIVADLLGPWTITLISAVAFVLVAIPTLLINYFGDVPRYTLALPNNVASRNAIRERGLALIRELSGSPVDYERIVIVGHSLGAVIAYDLVCLSWAEYVSAFDRAAKDVPRVDASSPLTAALGKLKSIVLSDEFNRGEYRKAQRRAFSALNVHDEERNSACREEGRGITLSRISRWRISDLVTIGSPLTHSQFLLARNGSEFKKRLERRELPTCPPTPDFKRYGREGRWSITYPTLTNSGEQTRMAHDAPFAFVRWTNVHDQPSNRYRFLRGDVFSGSVAGLFGWRRDVMLDGQTEHREPIVVEGVEDINVHPHRSKTSWLPIRCFTHNLYWEIGAMTSDPTQTPDWVKELRKAVNILDQA
jgi:hypothetical protein